MRGSGVSGLPHVVVILFVMILGCLALSGQCHTQNAGRTSSNAPTVKNTSVDDKRKITLKFRVSDFCNHNLCYCCQYKGTVTERGPSARPIAPRATLCAHRGHRPCNTLLSFAN
ncbi:hypothetical protein SEVIR_1G053150v4 [Setaria viridis]